MTEQDIIKAQNLWSEGIIKMGQMSNDRKSLENYASDFLTDSIILMIKYSSNRQKPRIFNLEIIKSLPYPILLQELTGNVMRIMDLHYLVGLKLLLKIQTLLLKRKVH